MPRYELMYILGSHVAEADVPTISQQVVKSAQDFGATEVQEQQLGKKKLAYPIKKTRNGYYVVVNFTMDSAKLNLFDAKIRTMDSSIIRYLIINLEERYIRQAKDAKARAKMMAKAKGPSVAERFASPSLNEEKTKTSPEFVLDLNQEELDKKIEAALSEDLTK